MKNIQLVHVGEDYIQISADGVTDMEITDRQAIEIIMVLGLALQKSSFEELKEEVKSKLQIHV